MRKARRFSSASVRLEVLVARMPGDTRGPLVKREETPGQHYAALRSRHLREDLTEDNIRDLSKMKLITVVFDSSSQTSFGCP